ncbi:MAG TPA: patatin-like phospholipase family protein [Burkholderiales bacterium]|nr:patatin-like phospholipase family protein [Burkholderiales bacterium]
MRATDLSPHEVATLQLQLKLTGDYPGLLHGVLDDSTREAVDRFRQREHARATPGLIDEQTRRALDRSAYATFDEQLAIEVDEIARARPPVLKTAASESKEPRQLAHDARLVGLAFSGGGIRSATFNLGVIQALAELKLLHLFDYVSTVSGGGYIGSWLSALITRRGGSIDGIARELCPDAGDAGAPGYSRESQAIRFLRGYSNYLTPRLGLLSADTLSAVATYLRNLYLNLTILILLLIAVLLVPRILVALIFAHPSALGMGFLWCGLGLLVVPTSAIVGANLAYRTPAAGVSSPWYAQTLSILLLFWVPGGTGAYLVACWFSVQPEPDFGYDLRWWALLGAIFALVAWIIGGIAYLFAEARDRRQQRVCTQLRGGMLVSFFYVLLGAIIAGAVGGVLFYWFTGILEWIWTTPEYGPNLARWLAAGLGTVVVMKLLAIALTLHVGLVGRTYSEDVREWWSRLGGSALAVGAAWLSLFLISVYVVPPLAVALYQWEAGGWATGGAVVSWIATTLAGVLLGKSEKTGPRDATQRNRVLEFVARIAPYVFIVGLLVGLSILIDALLPKLAGIDTPDTQAESFLASADQQFQQMDQISIWILLASAIGCLTTGLALSWRVDINLFSLYSFYRNRLTRCYLGATRAPHRQPQPFTGFDPEDDLPLHQLGRISGGGHLESQRPYHIVNTALNLVHGKDLEWQQRKAASFTFTPKFSGFELPPTADSRGYADPEDDAAPGNGYAVQPAAAPLAPGQPPTAIVPGSDAPPPPARPRAAPSRGCFRPTARTMNRRGAQLGVAFAISGAAASPNMGYHSSPALAFLMTVFNVRLGRWCGNPVNESAWTRPGPHVAAWRLLRELLGLTTSTSSYVYLSDGGHFENLGLYELVRRRCRFVVACDASQDGKFTFEDLGNAIRKCYADLGVPIELDLAPLRPRGDDRRSEWHCAVGTIRYDLRDPGAVPGVLLYLKPSLIGDEPADVLHYASTDPTFPHQTTNDQWFDESQFESYRKLGYHIGKCVLGPARAMAEAEANDTAGETSDVFGDVEGLIVALKSIWHPPAKGGAEVFTRHTRTLDAIYERLRSDRHLRFLDAQIYPNWKAIATGVRYEVTMEQWLPDTYNELREGFYLCNSVIQLMENVYLDLQLETQFDHPDNRGWMNLFRHWAWCNMFRVTWAMSAATYGMRFQSFCKRQLGLTLGDMGVKDVKESGDIGKLNFLEKDLEAQLVAQHTDLQRDALQIDRIEIVVSDPQESGKSVRLPVGLAITDSTSKEVVFFRIQDHLRRMGLGRVALRKLIQKRGVKGARPLTLVKPALETVGPEEQRRFERLFRSVLYELNKV